MSDKDTIEGLELEQFEEERKNSEQEALNEIKKNETVENYGGVEGLKVIDAKFETKSRGRRGILLVVCVLLLSIGSGGAWYFVWGPGAGTINITFSTNPVGPIEPVNKEGKELKPEEVYRESVDSIFVLKAETPLGQPLGSGFLVEPGNQIVTNSHVIDGAFQVTIKNKAGKSAIITDVLFNDPKLDIAVLPLPSVFHGTKPLQLQTATPKTGEPVCAIGAPKGIDFTFTQGIISQIRQPGWENQNSRTLIQTDTSLSPGNSGGPLLNMKAEVVGVIAWRLRQGNDLNFAVSALDVEKVFPLSKRRSLTDLDRYKYLAGVKKIMPVVIARLNEKPPSNQQEIIQESLLEAETMLKLNPQDGYAHLKKGAALSLLGKQGDALKSFNRAIKFLPNEEWAYALRARSKNLVGDFPGALRDCYKAIEVNRKNPFPYIFAAESHFVMEQYDDALIACKKAIRLNSNVEYTQDLLRVIESGKITSKAKKNWRRIKRYMSKNKTKGILGKPTRIVATKKEVWKYSYEGVGSAGTIVFDEYGEIESWIEPNWRR